MQTSAYNGGGRQQNPASRSTEFGRSEAGFSSSAKKRNWLLMPTSPWAGSWDVSIFDDIADSESQHMESAGQLFKGIGGMKETCQEPIRDIVLECVAGGVFTVDQDRRITYFNRAAEQITGLPGEQAIGQHCFNVLRASRCPENCALIETIETGRPVVCHICSITNAKGQTIPSVFRPRY